VRILEHPHDTAWLGDERRLMYLTQAAWISYMESGNGDVAQANAHCYWTMRKSGLNERTATNRLLGMSVAAKNELLYQHGTNFNNLPRWQKRGIGLYWEEYDKIGINPLTSEQTTARRRRIKRDFDLPMKEAYGEFIRNVLRSAS
jgi:tRNA(His) 5'-end guanylyltransferase